MAYHGQLSQNLSRRKSMNGHVLRKYCIVVGFKQFIIEMLRIRMQSINGSLDMIVQGYQNAVELTTILSYDETSIHDVR